MSTPSGGTTRTPDPPDTLGELDGPVTVVVQLPLRLDWSDRMVFHLEEPAERNLMYERVIREATRADDLIRLAAEHDPGFDLA